jgi:hypothetical protein
LVKPVFENLDFQVLAALASIPEGHASVEKVRAKVRVAIKMEISLTTVYNVLRVMLCDKHVKRGVLRPPTETKRKPKYFYATTTFGRRKFRELQGDRKK